MRYQSYLGKLRVPPPLEEIRANMLPMERETNALLGEILGEVGS